MSSNYIKLCYKVFFNVIFARLVWTYQLETGCKGRLLYLECTHLPQNLLPSELRFLKVEGDIGIVNKDLLGQIFMLQKLNMTNCNITIIKDGSFSEMKQLMTLVLTSNHIEFIGEYMFRNLPLLTELHIDKNDLKVIMPDSFKDSKYLKKLNLQNNQLLEIPADLPKALDILNLRYNEIEFINVGNLRILENLKELNLCNNPIIEDSIDNINMPMLKRLCIGCYPLLLQQNKIALPNLKELQLSGELLNRINFDNNTLLHLEQLEKLVLENLLLDKIEFLEYLKNVKIIYIKNITYVGENKFTLSTNLSELYIEESPELADLLLKSKQEFRQLKTLSLKSNNILNLYQNQSKELLKHVMSLDISNNPLNCILSEWKWIYELVKIYPSLFIDTENVKCDSPPDMKGRNLLTLLKNDDFSQFTPKKEKKIINDINMEQKNKIFRIIDLNFTYYEIPEFKSYRVPGLFVAIGLILTFLILLKCYFKLISFCEKMHKKIYVIYNRNGSVEVTIVKYK